MKGKKPVKRWAVVEPGGRVWVNNSPKALREETERDYCGPMDTVVRVEIREVPKKRREP